MVERSAPWPRIGLSSYFPSIEKKYGRSITEWQKSLLIAALKNTCKSSPISNLHIKWAWPTPMLWLAGRWRVTEQ